MNQATGAAIQTQGPQSLDASLGRKTFASTQPGYRNVVNTFMRAAALIGMLCVPASVKCAAPQTHTTTTLTVAPGASVSAGVPVTLTATVTFTSFITSGSVTAGTVVFCNANAVHCEDAAILGTAQLTAAGIATTKVTLGVGTYSIFAAYKADLFPASKSVNQALTVTAAANYFSFTSITASAPPSPYILTGTVAAFGTAPPTGTVTFFDVTSSSVVGTGVLNPATLGFTFVPASGSPAAVGFDPEVAILGDFNNDGKLDMAVAVGVQTPGSNTVSVLLGNGDGTFQAKTSYAPANFFAASILAGDFNHDGNLDLAVVISGNGDGTGTVNILLGNGDGTFQPQQTYIVGNLPDSIAMADFNGDGFLDLAVLNSADDNVTVLLGNGDGTFVLEQRCTAAFVPGTHTQGIPSCATATFPVGVGGEQIATADFNGDGFADLVVTNSQNKTVSVLLGVGDGTFQSQVTYAVGNDVHGIAVADFNGDGIPDLAVTNEQDNTVGVLLGIGNGTFQPQVTYATGPAPMGISVGDFKGNGNADLAVSNFESSSVSVFFNEGDGTGTFQPQAVFPGGGLPLQLVAGDLNGDGLSDLAVVNARQFPGNIFKATILLAAQTETATATGVVISGTQNVMATYPGDTIRAASQSVTIPVGPIATTTLLSCSPNPAFSGQLVTCTATVAPVPIGADSMDFFNGATSLGIADINSSGVATFTTSSLPLGPSSITAVFSGSAGFATSTSSAVIVTVNAQTVTTTTLVVAPNPAVAGQAVTFTATVTPAPTGAPLGTVNFFNGTTLLGSGTVNSSGVATFTTSSLPAGVLSLTATFSSNTGFAGSTSTVQSDTVKTATTTTLNVAPNPAFATQPVTFTATVTPAPTGTPLGTVNFLNGATLLGNGTVNSLGIATFTTSSLPDGVLSFTATYSSNAGFGGSTSTAQSVTVNPQTVTTTTLVVAPNPAIAGQPVTFTAMVTPAPTGTPLGTVNFFNGGTLLGSGTVNSSGVATLTTSSLPAGVLSLTAIFSSNAGFAGSTSTVQSVTVSAQTVATTTTLNVAPNPATAGVAVTFTATVTPAPTGTPAGTVTFKKGIMTLGTGTLNASGIATFTTSSLSAGTSGFSANYSGNAGFAASASAILSVTVNATITTTSTLTVSPNPALAGQPVTFTVTVAPAPTGAPLGTVNFLNGATSLGMVTLNSAGVATFTISSLASGTDVITAVFSGNVASSASTSAPVNLVISPAFAITGPTAPITVAAGGMVNVNISVGPLGGSFTNAVTMSAAGLPSGGTATFNPPIVTPGTAGATTVLTLAFSASAQLIPKPGKNQPLVLFGFAAVAMCLFMRKRKQLVKSWAMALACAALACGMIALPGCGTTSSGTKSQTVVVTVTGTSGLVHESTTITLILK